MPFFSTIIPAYNRVALIGQTIDSVLAQTDSDQEIIVIDDGSTDDTAGFVEANYGGKVRVFREVNRGPGAARNAGIRRAAGKYVTFLDSDDLWFPWTLATYRRAIEENSGPSFVAGRGFHFTDPAEARGVTHAAYDAQTHADYYAASHGMGWIPTCATAILTETLRTVGGFTDQRVNAEDSDLWMKLGTAPGFVEIAAPVVFGYRRHPASAIANLNLTYRGLLSLIDQEKRGAYPGGRERRHERLSILATHVRPASVALAKTSDHAAAWTLYRRTAAWQCQVGRLRYLLGFPLVALRSRLFSRPTPPEPPVPGP